MGRGRQRHTLSVERPTTGTDQNSWRHQYKLRSLKSRMCVPVLGPQTTPSRTQVPQQKKTYRRKLSNNRMLWKDPWVIFSVASSVGTLKHSCTTRYKHHLSMIFPSGNIQCSPQMNLLSDPIDNTHNGNHEKNL